MLFSLVFMSAGWLLAVSVSWRHSCDHYTLAVLAMHRSCRVGQTCCPGRIIEFPLTNVSKVCRIVKNDNKWWGSQVWDLDAVL